MENILGIKKTKFMYKHYFHSYVFNIIGRPHTEMYTNMLKVTI